MPLPFNAYLSEEMPIFKTIQSAGGTAIIVGGWVRDALLMPSTPPSTDLDIEVFGIASYAALCELLRPFGAVKEVGKQFGIALLHREGHDMEFALPRTEIKMGSGHRGFSVTPDPTLPFETAAARRDFTINSMGYNPLTQDILDPFNGQQDLKNKILRHIGPAFSEDPLRVLRAVQLAARFDLKIAPETIALCQTLDIAELPKERLLTEFEKLLLKAQRPSIGFQQFSALGLLRYFPELAAIQGVPQDPTWHPEGDVWIHTMMVVDEMAKRRTGDPSQDIVDMLAALCHDFGKSTTTHFVDGHWRSRGHEQAGVAPTKRFLARLTDSAKIIDPVCDLVRYHLRPALLYQAHQTQGVSDAAIRRLALKINIQHLVHFTTADHFGRGTSDAKAQNYPAGDWLLERAKRLNVHAGKPVPILQGRHLVELGMSPGPKMGGILNKLFRLQIEGTVTTLEEAIALVKSDFLKHS